MCALRDRTARPPECLGCVTAFRTRESIPCAAMRLSLHEKRRDHFRHAFCLFNCLTNTPLTPGGAFIGRYAATSPRLVFAQFIVPYRAWQAVSSFLPASGHKKSREPLSRFPARWCRRWRLVFSFESSGQVGSMMERLANWELLCKTLYFSIFYYEQCCKYNFKNKHH